MDDRFDYSNYRLSSPLSDVEPYYDVIVIGSGYGGSIAASRCSRAKKKVCLFEKGREWWPGDFDEGVGAAKDMQMTYNNSDGECVQIGKPTNLYDIVVGPEVAVVQGVGLGGTSLINANVCLDADPRVFEDKAWPEALRDDIEALNSMDRKRFMAMMKPQEYPQSYPSIPKLDAMKEIAHDFVTDIEDLRVDDVFYRTPLYVNFKTTKNNVAGIPQPACNNCGNCVGGCNTGAKNTLNMNFIPDAYAHGAKIFTEIQVNAVERHEEEGYWVVFYKSLHQTKFEEKERIVKAHTVILGAGALGSTRILLNSASRGLPLSGQIGKRFTTNGDHLTISYNGKREIRPVGIKLEDIKSPSQGPGPCITSILDVRRRPEASLDDGYLLEDGTPPSATENIYKLLLKFTKGIDTTPNEKEVAEFIRAITGKAFENTLTFLSMSHDSASGRIVQDQDSGNVWADFPGVGDEGNFQLIYEAARKATATLEGELMTNPLWEGAIPQLRNKKGIVTVHPLGGCSMGESGKNGVVDHAGAVFKGEGLDVYPNLLVVDGAVMPRSVGVNPTLTIGTIAERCVRLLADRNGWTINYSSSKKIDPSVKQENIPGLRFTERMAGHLTVDGEDHPCEFLLTIVSNDVRHMLDVDLEHRASLHGTLLCKGLSDYPLTVSNGRFRLFRESNESPDVREMVYEMDLHDHDKSYHFRGIKIIDKNCFLEIGVGDTTTLSVIVRKPDAQGEDFGKGTLKIKLTDFMQQLTTLKVLDAENLLQETQWKIRFARFFSGILLDIYGTFNPSDLGVTFRNENKPREQRQLNLGGKTPEVHRIQATDGVQLPLVRYQGGSKGPILLLHGLGVSSRIFTLDTVDTNMVEFLFSKEFDVWVVDMRYSIMLPIHNQPGYIGDAAEKDLPPTVDYILEKTGKPNLQLLGHCAGGVTAHAALLGGLLQGKIRCFISSQAGFSLTVGALNRAKSSAHLPTLLYGIGIKGISAYPDNPNSWNQCIVNHFVDMVATLTTDVREHCDSEVCHRVTFTYSLLWSHRNVNELTHDTLQEWNGFVHATRLKHFALSMRKGRLVDEGGHDKYVPDFNSRHRLESKKYREALKHLDIPILYFSGANNVCWDPETTRDSFERCKEVNPDQHYERFEVENYMHLDCIMGSTASRDVFPRLMDFLEKYARLE
ncbi:uncharacterized protein LOC129258758 [Lytechinus pictus]|uniref:uncharacterized protein LOC129258758 n=1 Tax=Lytechinus pictus TaxID=7653 RepID=UPI0030B9DF39